MYLIPKMREQVFGGPHRQPAMGPVCLQGWGQVRTDLSEISTCCLLLLELGLEPA